MATIFGLYGETYYQVFPTLQDALQKHQTHGREAFTAQQYKEEKVLLVNERGGYCFAKVDDLKDVHVNANFPNLQNRLNYLMGAKSKSVAKKELATAL